MDERARVIVPKEDQLERLESELRKQKDIVRQLLGVIVKSMIVVKLFVRVVALVLTYYKFGKVETYYRAGFIFVVWLIQLTIDRARQVAAPEVRLSEWRVFWGGP